MRRLMVKDLHIAITGTLCYRRQDAFDMISLRGGIPQSCVTHDTDILVVGYYRKNTIRDGKSNKLRTAERYIGEGRKIRIISEFEFLIMLWSSAFDTNAA